MAEIAQLHEAEVVTEVEIPEKELEALRSMHQLATHALAELGEAHLQEAADRRAYERSAKLLRAAEAGAKHAIEQRTQVQKAILIALKLEDGSWDLDLEAGKLVRGSE